MQTTDAPPDAGRLRLVRWGGFTGAALLAVAGWLGGVRPEFTAAVTPVSIWRGGHGPLLLAAWLVGTAVLVAAWWGGRRAVGSTRWAYLTVALWALPLLVTVPLGSRDVYSYACQGWVYADGGDPYAGGVAAAGCPWLDAISPIWRDTPAPYGPVFVLLAGAAAALGGSLVGTVALLRVVAVAGVLLAAGCLPGLARAVGASPGRAVWLVLACPLVGVHLVAGAHNDAVMVGLLLAGLLLVVRHPGRRLRLLAGGALLGLAVAVKATAVVAVPFAALAAVAGVLTVRALLRDGGWVAGGAAGALLGVSMVSGLGLGWVGGLAHSGDSQQWTSPPTAVGFTVNYAGRLLGRDPDAVPIARAVAVLALVGLLVALWLWACASLRRPAATRRAETATGQAAETVAGPGTVRPGAAGTEAARPTGVRARVALTGAGLALAATVALAPVFHPWYAVWPLAVLAVCATRTTWFLLPCAVASFLTLPDGTNLARFSKAPGALLMTAGVLWLLARTVPLLASRARPGPPPAARP
ncbi:polyprenol phosphomannose-dependent alpha 1,6 mannosyltransferase MptB [Micromonospora sp. WMMD882]|uniref:polyprenol phosphomannose-dependent alpha 1,6 mannosyltransferase MptB n=1 Tax=Micromonospora sp. WMMD882 TaxID=3015151 RepID=UPI00248BC904|nr:polyprenol phosphomannose-dependent alpha 1,6 mannosyltransferase MptB [Micromonospora sp. WMMD882]WBB82226.1 polyprenol phosphomannose-dependent alpha 1,6 mannosyltransferase MptB [Micromonospora sp. WMMD882]